MNVPISFIGKTIKSFEYDDVNLVIVFTDGSALTIAARGTEEQWLDITLVKD